MISHERNTTMKCLQHIPVLEWAHFIIHHNFTIKPQHVVISILLIKAYSQSRKIIIQVVLFDKSCIQLNNHDCQNHSHSEVCRVYFYIFTTLLPHLYYTFSAPSLHFWIMLLSWYSKPSQQQWIISGLKTNFNLSLLILHKNHQTTNSLKSTQPVPIQIHTKPNTHTQSSNTKFLKN